MPLGTTRRKRIDRTRGHLYNNDYPCISHSPFYWLSHSVILLSLSETVSKVPFMRSHASHVRVVPFGFDRRFLFAYFYSIERA